jgi:glycosyltransferase involved in cell wall biosynthesis
MTPLVTVVVATYRPDRFLKTALASAASQTLGDLEVIVADDGGDPAVRGLVESFDDPRIVYKRNAERLGPARNHWAAFAAARGKYLSILNHDDQWRPTFLERLTEPLERDADLVLAFCDHDVIDADGDSMPEAAAEASERWGRRKLKEGPRRPFQSLVVRQAIPIAMGSVFRRDALELPSLPDVGPAYDLWLAYELARHRRGAWFVRDRLSAWRQHPNQLTQSRNRAWAAGAVACWKAMAADPLFASHPMEIAAKLSAASVEASRSALTERDWKDARISAATAVAASPSNWRAWWAFGLAHLPIRQGAG